DADGAPLALRLRGAHGGQLLATRPVVVRATPAATIAAAQRRHGAADVRAHRLLVHAAPAPLLATATAGGAGRAAPTGVVTARWKRGRAPRCGGGDRTRRHVASARRDRTRARRQAGRGGAGRARARRGGCSRRRRGAWRRGR